MAQFDGATQTAVAIYRPRSTRIEPLVEAVDVYLSEEHERQVTKTKYPIESGASLTDHAVREPDRLKIQGFTSHLQPSSPALRNQPDRPALAWAEIDRLMNARELVEVATILGVYTDMLIVRAIAPVSNTTGRDLLFTLELEQVQTERLRTIEIEPAPGGPAVGRSTALARGNEASTDVVDLIASSSIAIASLDDLAAFPQTSTTPDPFGEFDLGARLDEFGGAVGDFFDESGTLLNSFFSDVISPQGLNIGGAAQALFDSGQAQATGEAGIEVFETTGGIVEDVNGIVGGFFDQLGTKIGELSGDS